VIVLFLAEEYNSWDSQKVTMQGIDPDDLFALAMHDNTWEIFCQMIQQNSSNFTIDAIYGAKEKKNPALLVEWGYRKRTQKFLVIYPLSPQSAPILNVWLLIYNIFYLGWHYSYITFF
jgi:phage terminase small subunit